MLDHAWIAAHIPHQGSMCLLGSVLQWDSQRIRCRANSHRNPDNPLRSSGQLGSACGIEYAAQAMAVHGALLAPADGTRPHAGFLVSVRGTTMHVPRLDNIDADLDIEAVCLNGDGGSVLYQFSLRAAGRLLLDGRAAVVLNQEAVTQRETPTASSGEAP